MTRLSRQTEDKAFLSSGTPTVLCQASGESRLLRTMPRKPRSIARVTSIRTGPRSAPKPAACACPWSRRFGRQGMNWVRGMAVGRERIVLQGLIGEEKLTLGLGPPGMTSVKEAKVQGMIVGREMMT